MNDVPEVTNGPGWVIMEHPNLPGQYAEVTEDALAQAWAPLGWTKVEPPGPSAVTSSPPGPQPLAATKTTKVSA